MSDKNLKNIMDTEIEKRLESPEWDLKIAGKIVSEARHRKKRRYAAASISSMAAAAVIIIAIFPNPGGNTAGEYELLIKNQLDGIYTQVFNEKYISSYKSGNDEAVLYDNIDVLIDNTLSKR
ncbi:MAG: hypothetical protein MUC95_04245 [Spirochaetes bacterium]|jgi:hypothetical protein|nr:hypothetical protein [Spirochaetota bacterium]